MGKTKTAFVSDATETKSSEEAYREKKERQAAEAKIAGGVVTPEAKERKTKPQKEKHEKVHIAGLKGGQRIKMIGEEETLPPAEDTNTVSNEDTKKTKKPVKEKIRGKNYQEKDQAWRKLPVR